MENLILTYKPLFSIEIWHDYFLRFLQEDDSKKLLNVLPSEYDIRPWIHIRPTQTTLQVLKNYGLKCMIGRKGLDIYAQAESIGVDVNGRDIYKTYFRLDHQVSFTFELFVINAQFLVFTNIPSSLSPSNLLYFNSLNKKKTDDGNYITEPLTSFSIGNDNKYGAGSLVTNLDNNSIYESIKGSSLKADLTDPTKWLKFEYKNAMNDPKLAKGIHAVTDKDLLPKLQGTYNYGGINSAVRKGKEINFELKDVFDQVIELGNAPGTNYPQNRIQAPDDVNIPIRHQLFLNHLPNGKYKLSISGEANPKFFYLVNRSDKEAPFAVIDIFGDTPNADFQFFETKKVNQKEETIIQAETKKFKLRFKNRTTTWRYYNNGDNSGNPQKELIYPLSKYFLKLPDDLPNPSPNQIKVIKDTGTGEILAFYSDTYLYDVNI